MDLTQLVVDELARIFPDATIYTENQTKGFQEPSFYVSRVPITQVSPALFDIQERTYSYQVVYFANPDQPNQDMEHVQDLLSDNFITLTDQATVINREFKPDKVEHTVIFMFDIFLRMHRVNTTKKFDRKVKVNVNGKHQDN